MLLLLLSIANFKIHATTNNATCVTVVVGDDGVSAAKVATPTDVARVAQIPPLQMKWVPAEKAP